MDKYKLDLLKGYFPKRKPMGPISSDKLTDARVMKALFDTENRIYRELTRKPSLIVGRKGAGKTAFLRSVQLEDQYKITTEIKTHEAFLYVVQSIEQISTDLPFVESVAEIWDTVFWTAIFSELAKKQYNYQDSLSTIETYLDGLGITKASTADSVIKDIINTISEKSKGTAGVAAAVISKLAFNDVSFASAKDAAERILKGNKVRAVVLMDSMENFPLNQKKIARALAGLLKTIGQFHGDESLAEIRFCIPAEMWHSFYELSSNPLKDFEHHVTIHWHAGELIRIAANRLSIYIAIHDPNLYDFLDIGSYNLHDRKEAIRFFKQIMPDTITNGLGQEEESIAYILRHTQLLPRQLFTYFVQIIARNKRAGSDISNIRETSIKEGIYGSEVDITNEIFSAYHYLYPCARKVCEKCIPYLPFEFSVGHLHQVFNRHAKKVCKLEEFDDFLRMLIEIGVVGRVINRTDRYIEGVFEYTVPHKLVVSTEDILCLHPSFCQVFNAIYSDQGEKVVYPYGSDLDGTDYRDW
jgi:hypothetical protein